VDALFAQAGVIRADTIGELFDVAALLCDQPPPAGARVAIVSNAGGPAVLAADAADAGGLELVTPSARLARTLRGVLQRRPSLTTRSTCVQVRTHTTTASRSMRSPRPAPSTRY